MRASAHPLGMVLIVTASHGSLGGTPPAVAYSYGTIVNSCGSTDQVVMILVLTTRSLACNQQPTEPYVSLMIDPGFTFPKTITFPVKNRNGDARRCAGGTCEPVASGTIVLDQAVKKGIAGHYDLTFKEGDSAAGLFQIRRCSQKNVCW
jgi:hypothetical protein